jgi:hypothetical protein
MTDFVATVPTWVVLTDLVQLCSVDVGQQFTANHPCEVFTDDAEAVAYALSIGWTPPAPEVD